MLRRILRTLSALAVLGLSACNIDPVAPGPSAGSRSTAAVSPAQGDPGESCGGATVTPPPPHEVVWPRAEWRMAVEVSEDDGLVLRDVMLGRGLVPGYRYMAQTMSLPYGILNIRGRAPQGRFELAANRTTSDGTRSRLVGYQEFLQPDGVVVQAVYALDRFPIAPTGCLIVTQRYEFRARVDQDQCEPTGGVPCARFYPTVSYAYSARDREDAIVDRVVLPQRLHFRPDAPLDKYVADAFKLFASVIIRDQEDLVPGVDLLRGENPLRREAWTYGAIEGKGILDRAGDPNLWDNMHTTWNTRVDQPDLYALRPGCPECVHMHWRWGTLTRRVPGFADHNDGKPRIPQGSNQDIRVGLVKYRGRGVEEDPPFPRAWYDFIDGDFLADEGGVAIAGPVFWYEGTGRLQADRFLTHGAWFNPQVGGYLNNDPDPLNVALTGDATALVTIRNRGDFTTANGTKVVLLEVRNITKSDIPFPFHIRAYLVGPGGFVPCQRVSIRGVGLNPDPQTSLLRPDGVANISLLIPRGEVRTIDPPARLRFMANANENATDPEGCLGGR